MENLYRAWEEFVKGKQNKMDVVEFALNLSDNIYGLHQDLANHKYCHGSYHHFRISDPKPRDIHKASVRDRLLHHAVHRVLYTYFDRKFVNDSYSCRVAKGTHKAMDRFRAFAYKVSKNNTKTCWVLKCDIKKFFASIDHATLKEILAKRITDRDTLRLLGNVIDSFDSGLAGKGLPLGNLTSQILVNIHMNEFDQFVKHKLKVKYYIRYADDFVILSQDKTYLEFLMSEFGNYLQTSLALTLHPDKCYIKTFASGVDFLGWIHFPTHRVLRTSSKRRMFRNLGVKPQNGATVSSYLGMLGHGDAWKLTERLREL